MRDKAQAMDDTDIGMTDDEERDDFFGQFLSEQAVRYAYPVVDAALWSYLETLQALTDNHLQFRRRQQTSGSCRYNVSGHFRDQRITIGEFFVSMAGDTLSHIYIVPADSHPNPPQAQGWMSWQLALFQEWIDNHIQRVYTIANRDHTKSLVFRTPEQMNAFMSLIAHENTPLKSKPHGRRPTSLNEWARQQIQHGHDREEIFQEYRRRYEQDNTNPQVKDKQDVDRLRDQFRKAITRKGRTK